MNAVVFPGQGAQFEGMGKELYQENPSIRRYFDKANDILGIDIKKAMFEGSKEDLKQTNITQPSVYIYSLSKFFAANIDLSDFSVDYLVAGHSLGEISALVACQAISYEDGLFLVKERAEAMQEACESNPGTMAAVIALENDKVEKLCKGINEIVVAANYNCPGQLVISGTIEGIDLAVEAAKSAGARMAIKLEVGGAFHSPLMAPAAERLSKAIDHIEFKTPIIPIVQNVDASVNTDPIIIKELLNKQLISPVRWMQIMEVFKERKIGTHIEVGAKVLTGFIRKFDRSILTEII